MRARHWILLALALSGTCQAAPAPIKVAVGLSLPPYILREENRGLEFDIVKAGLAECQRELQPVYTAYGSIGTLLANRRVEAAMTLNEKSGVTAFYSQPHIRYHDFAITLKSQALPVKTVDDLRPWRMVAFQNARDELGPGFHKVTEKHPQYTETGQQVLQNRMLMKQAVDVVVADRLIFEHYQQLLARQGEPNLPVTYHDVFEPIEYKVAFNDAGLRDCFNKALQHMKQTGDYQRIQSRYGVTAD